MTLSYPRTIPASLVSIQKVSWRPLNVNSISTSPFSLVSQVYTYNVGMWMAECTLPQMSRDAAESWIGFLLSLRGLQGSFLLWDPANAEIRGTATSATLSADNGTDYGTVTMTGTLLAGDMFQLGSGSSATLHKVVAGKTNSGTLTFWPPVRRDVINESLVLSKACGVFQLSSNVLEWDVSAISGYGVTFAVQEKIG